jgi:hypothetical protein
MDWNTLRRTFPTIARESDNSLFSRWATLCGRDFTHQRRKSVSASADDLVRTCSAWRWHNMVTEVEWELLFICSRLSIVGWKFENAEPHIPARVAFDDDCDGGQLDFEERRDGGGAGYLSIFRHFGFWFGHDYGGGASGSPRTRLNPRRHIVSSGTAAAWRAAIT